MNRSGAGVEHSGNRHLLTCELLRSLLITQCVGIASVVQNKECAVCIHAGDGALGVCRSHTHLTVVTRGAHAVRNSSCERALCLRRPEGGDDEKNDEGPHAGWLVPRRHKMSGRRARIHDPNATLVAVLGQANCLFSRAGHRDRDM